MRQPDLPQFHSAALGLCLSGGLFPASSLLPHLVTMTIWTHEAGRHRVQLPGHKIPAPVARQPGGPANRSRAECVMILASVAPPMPLLMLQEMSLGHHRVGRQPPACPQQPRPGVSSESPGYPAWLFHPGYSWPCRSSVPLPPPSAAPQSSKAESR